MPVTRYWNIGSLYIPSGGFIVRVRLPCPPPDLLVHCANCGAGSPRVPHVGAGSDPLD